MRPTPDGASPHDDARDAREQRDQHATAQDAVAGRAADLRRRLAELPLDIEHARCAVGGVAVPSYPDGPRPSSTITLAGRGSTGRGEHVGWTEEAHRACARRIERLSSGGATRVGDFATRIAHELGDPYDRAALEAAAIDLALRQADSNLFRLSGCAPRPLRYVLSFERVADPITRAQQELAANPALGLKVDVDPAWRDATFAALAALDRVCVLDFKLSGSVADHERAHRLLPAALLEDPLPAAEPWSDSLRARLSLDAAIGSAAAIAQQNPPPVAVNVKPARIGGVLAALDVVAACATRGIAVYVGGMFEVGVGRTQLHALAALLCPDAPNDVAPITLAGRDAVRPPRLDASNARAGFANDVGNDVGNDE